MILKTSLALLTSTMYINTSCFVQQISSLSKNLESFDNEQLPAVFDRARLSAINNLESYDNQQSPRSFRQRSITLQVSIMRDNLAGSGTLQFSTTRNNSQNHKMSTTDNHNKCRQQTITLQTSKTNGTTFSNVVKQMST